MSGRAAAIMLALGILLASLITGCRADVAVDVTVDRDGSGTVEVTIVVDSDVVAQIADLPGQLRTDDLAAAGWALTNPVRLSDGGMRLTASKEVPSADQFGEVLAEIHPDLFPQAELDVRRSFGTTRYVWSSALDRTVGFDVFGDPEVASLLGGEAFGVPVEELEARTGGPLEDAVNVSFTVTMPDGTTTTFDGGPLGADEVDEIGSTATVVDRAAVAEHDRAEDLRRAVALWAAAAGVWMIVVAGAAWLWLRRHRRGRAG
jgi:hypothetical protein